MKRTREMPLATKEKISKALKGKPKSQAWKNKISAGQKKAWASVPKASTDFTSTGRIV